MSVLVLGMSHRSAPVDLLERAALDTEESVKLLHHATDIAVVTEAAVISTCNRVEIYVETERFHGCVEPLTEMLADHAGLDRDELVQHVYVHFDEQSVGHLFRVASGLDSMIPGESQILGQVRSALHQAQAEATAGPALNALFQQALRIGKRGHAETGIDKLAPSIVTAAFDAAGPVVGAKDSRYLVAGAGTMATLAILTLIDRGVEPSSIWVANRTFQRAFQFVATHGVSAVRWDAIDTELSGADVLICCTGAAGAVFDAERIARVVGERPITIVDVALPRDVAPDVRDLPNVNLVDIEVLASAAENVSMTGELEQVRGIVGDEVRSFLAARNAAKVTPMVVALRGMATEIVQAEYQRVVARIGADLSEAQLTEIRNALRRSAEKLIHAPTVRVKELVEDPKGLTYADALAHLFALQPGTAQSVSNLPTSVVPPTGGDPQ